MEFIGIYQDGSQLKVAAMGRDHLIERLDAPPTFSKEEWPGLIVSGIDGGKVLVRHITSPLKKRRALEKTLPFQLESLIPYSLDQVVVRPIYQIGKEEAEATFFITAQTALEDHVQEYDPSWVSCIPMALYRFAVFTGQEEESYVIFHVGRLETEIVSIHQGMVQHNISIGIGIEHLEEAYEKDHPEEKGPQKVHAMRLLDLGHLPKALRLSKLLQNYQREIDRAFCFLSHKHGSDQLKTLLFAGETQVTFQLESWIKSWETFSYLVLPIEGHRGYDSDMIKTYAIPIGLALDALHQDKKSIQFRQGNWVAPKIYEGIKKRVAKGVSLCLASAAALFLIGHVAYNQKEKRFLEEIQEFAAAYASDLPQLEKVGRYKTPKEKIQFLNKNIKVMKSDYRYFSPPPLVADALAFLSEHPKLCRREGEKKIEINHLHYELIKYPSVDHPYDPYKVQVSVVFTSPEAVWAREFHDAIVEDTVWVDPEGEVTWDRKQNAYTLSFILK